MKVPYIDLQRSHQSIKAELMDAFSRVIDHGGFCLGPEVSDFENSFADQLGLKACVAVGSGTEALHLLARAMDIGPGDEVIIPAFSFIASAWFAEYVGARIVYADVSESSFCLDPSGIEKLITEKTKAIVVTHLYGQSADMNPILAIAKEHGIKVVEDAAQAHLAKYNGRPVGSMGDAAIFSFYPTKNLGAVGEGGAVASNDQELLEKIRILRAHGSKERYLHHYVGYNNRMEGLQAASLNVKLPSLPGKTAQRQGIARRYLGGIKLEGARLPQPIQNRESVYHVFTFLHPERDRLRTYLAEKGVGTDIVYPIPLHLQPCFEYLGHKKGDFPVAEKLANECLSLPIFPELEEDEIEYVIDSINAFE